MGIIRIQGREECTYNEACNSAAKLLDSNSELFRKAVQAEVSKQDRSNIMSRINKSKTSWMEKGRLKGVSEGHAVGYSEASQEYKITYPCSICGGSMTMMPDAVDHKAMILLMKEKGWAHSTCLK